MRRQASAWIWAGFATAGIDNTVPIGHVMHVKCIHDVYSLLGHILSYLIVLLGHGHVFH
jgi:hypothetical protein